MAHAPFAPSSAMRWSTCHASYAEETGYKDEESPFAAEGTEAHDLLERAIKAKTRPSELEPDHPAAHDVNVCYDLIEVSLHDPNLMVMSEVKVKLTDDCYGTADVIIIDPKQSLLVVVDYKHGRGVIVEPDCEQLLIYAMAAMRDFDCMLDKSIEHLQTTIVQPRASHDEGPIRTKMRPRVEAMGELTPILAAMEDIKAGSMTYAPSESACRFCKARANCKAIADKALAGVRSMFTEAGCLDVPTAEDGRGLTNEQKAAVLEARGLFNIFIKAIEEDVETTLLSGKSFPGYKLVAGRSNRVFDGDEEEIQDFCRNVLKLKPSEFSKTTLLGPAPIEKLIDTKKRGGKAKLEQFHKFVVKPEGKPTIVPESDKRPAIQPFFKDETSDPLA